jgi:hypothetical protein
LHRSYMSPRRCVSLASIWRWSFHLRSQVRFALSSSPVFSRTDTITDSERFYNSILELFDDPEEQQEVDDLLTWWNRYVKLVLHLHDNNYCVFTAKFSRAFCRRNAQLQRTVRWWESRKGGQPWEKPPQMRRYICRSVYFCEYRFNLLRILATVMASEITTLRHGIALFNPCQACIFCVRLYN